MTHNRLSVVIPAYNAQATIAECVRSTLTIADRVIVVDDGSTDRTAQIAEGLGARVVRQPNQGAYAARRKGAEIADSPFILFLDADDQVLPNGVRQSLQLLEGDSRVGVAAGVVVGMDRQGKRTVVRRAFTSVDAASLLSHGYSPWPPAAQVVRSSAYLEQSQLAVPALAPRYADDYELLLRMALVSRIETHLEPSCIYRVDGGKSARNALKVVEAKERLRSYYGAYCAVSWEPLSSRQRRAAANARAAHAALNRGALGEACILALRVAALDPSVPARAIRRRITTR